MQVLVDCWKFKDWMRECDIYKYLHCRYNFSWQLGYLLISWRSRLHGKGAADIPTPTAAAQHCLDKFQAFCQPTLQKVDAKLERDQTHRGSFQSKSFQNRGLQNLAATGGGQVTDRDAGGSTLTIELFQSCWQQSKFFHRFFSTLSNKPWRFFFPQ